MIAILGGIIGFAAIAVFIAAIRLSYAIEARSDPKKAMARFGYTNIFGVALNWRVARYAETQAMRWRLLKHLAVMAVLFVLLALLAAGIAADRMN